MARVQESGGNGPPPLNELDVGSIKSDGKKGFLDIPLEIRMLFYETFFGAQGFAISQPKIKSGDADAGKPVVLRATARQKLSLLVTNHTVCREGFPFFARLHVVNMRLLNVCHFSLPTDLSIGVGRALRATRHIELTYQHGDLDSSTDHNISSYLSFFRRGCHALKSLRVDFVQFSCLSNTETQWAYQLQRLWPRLDSLQVCVEHWDELDTMPQGELIAPGQKWHGEVCEDPLLDAVRMGRRRGLKRTVYCVARDKRADGRR